jgi:hypothetical protein
MNSRFHGWLMGCAAGRDLGCALFLAHSHARVSVLVFVQALGQTRAQTLCALMALWCLEFPYFPLHVLMAVCLCETPLRFAQVRVEAQAQEVGRSPQVHLVGSAPHANQVLDLLAVEALDRQVLQHPG